MNTDSSPIIGIVMGSKSDWPTMQHASELLQKFNVPHDCQIVSAHRTPQWLVQYAEEAQPKGLKMIIAGAGGAAHLPGMIAAQTPVPVLGVPVESEVLKGLDSLLSIVQMPAGIPVATFAVGRAGALNAGLFAVATLAQYDEALSVQLAEYRDRQTLEVRQQQLPIHNACETQ